MKSWSLRLLHGLRGNGFAAIQPVMYQKGEVSSVKQAFWATFGQYMKPVLSAEVMDVNWINYKTGFRHLYFRMDAFQSAQISIDMTHPDTSIQMLYFEQFVQLKALFRASLEEEWTWQPPGSGTHGRIYCELKGYSIMNRENWPELISFFKPRIIGLDAFWTNARNAFEALL